MSLSTTSVFSTHQNPGLEDVRGVVFHRFPLSLLQSGKPQGKAPIQDVLIDLRQQ
jgi:hypothetical protein